MIETVIFFFTVGKNDILSNPVSSYRLDGGKKPAKDDDRLQNALSVRSGLKLFFFFKPYVFEGCYFYYVLIIVRGSAFWLERLCNICAFNVMQNTTCMRGEQKVPPPLGRVRRGIFTQYSPLAKNNNFAHDCHANA